MQKVWHKLIEFETRDLVERALERRHGRSPSARVINEVTSNFIQAREYYLNAEKSAITVRPLLLYYGVLALSRGLILALDIQLSESALKPAHGLEIKEWRGTLKNELRNVCLLEIGISEGAFYDLLKTTENRSYFRGNCSEVNWMYSFDLPNLGTRLSFEDIIKCIPDLSEEYRIWKDKEFVASELKAFKSSEPEHHIATLKLPVEIEHLKQILPVVNWNILNIDVNQTEINVDLPKSYVPYFVQKLHDHDFVDIGDIYLVPPIQESVYLNTLSLYFSASYVLGMLTRYFPSIWISLGRVEKGDGIFPLINRLMSLIQNDYPQIVLDFLRSPYKFET
ncbi:YaaC family protein [Leptolyngbya sp. FACHB-261]|uniref:YaaC family protein n=1 Tax=Leptolyngbya sp. FACHB-261 TaxID=2692806 RepID=UPI001682E7AF|nr:YaaC family protein [Leptolyngbya sp. FACHB-261]MBD2099785.1 hypothetical protein [Leptolyngbya sp. FACHB-261]